MCHETNKVYCESIGDTSQVHWEDAPDWQRVSAEKGVLFALENQSAPNSAVHDSWRNEKVNEGWVYGEVKDAEKKTHPCLVPYDELPQEQQAKDALFRTIVLVCCRFP